MDRLIAIVLAAACAAPALAQEASSGTAPDAAERAQAPPIVAEVRLRLPPGDDPAAIEALVAVREGQPLTRHALRRTALLVHQLGRFADVAIRTEPLPDGRVTVTVECVPRRMVRAVRVRHLTTAGLAPDRVLRVAGLAPGQELHSARLTRAAELVAAEYRRRGWRSAGVEVRASAEREGEVEIVVEEGPQTRVVALDLSGGADSVVDAARVLRVRPGAALDEEVLDGDVARVRAALRERGHLRSRVEAPAVTIEGVEARIVIPVEIGPRLRFRFAGHRSVTSDVLTAHLGLDPDQPVDSAAVAAAAARVRGFYLGRGHADARVTAREITAAGEVVVLFEIEEGRRFRIGDVRFTGAAHRDPRWLRARLLETLSAGDGDGDGSDVERAARSLGSTRPPVAAPPRRAAETWDPARWDAAVARIVDLYRADGFLEATHEGTRVSLDARRGLVDVEIGLREGPRTLVASVEFYGRSAMSDAELRRECRITSGGPLSYAAIEQTRAAILALYARRGFLYARVADREEISPDRTSADVRFTVDEGPQVRIGNVVVSGNRRTSEELVRDTLALHSGDVYDPDAAARSQAGLLRLGVFRSVALRLGEPDVPEETKDLTVDLAERPWRSLSPGVGFSIANGPRAFVELVQPNLWGKAVEGTARAKVNYLLETFRSDLPERPEDRIEFRTDFGLHDRRIHFAPVPVGARADMILERVHRRAYDLARGSTVLGLDLAATSRFSVSLQYELELDHIERNDNVGSITLTRADLERLRLDEGYTTLHSVRPVVTLDFRDNAVHPRRGWYASGTVDYVRSIGGGEDTWFFGLLKGSNVFTNMLKLSGTASTYLPLGSGSVLALSVRGGRVLPLDRDSRTIGPKRFFLGGASTMRGYAEDEMIPEDERERLVEQLRACAGSESDPACSDAARQFAAGKTFRSEGGEAFFLGKLELRFPVRGALEAGVFADVGNLWLDPRQATLKNLRVNVGFGLRFATPIGPAVVDVGLNVDPDGRLDERVVAPHFSIGLF